MTFYEKATKIKVLDLEKLWNFKVDNLIISNHLVIKNYIQISQKFEIQIL
jgi:hypothetical protein